MTKKIQLLVDLNGYPELLAKKHEILDAIINEVTGIAIVISKNWYPYSQKLTSNQFKIISN